MPIIGIPKSISRFDTQLGTKHLAKKTATFKPAVMTTKMNTFSPGGSLGDIEVPNGRIEPLIYNIGFIEHLDDIYKLIGDTLQVKYVDFTFRGVESNGIEKNDYVIQIQGYAKEIDPSEISSDATNEMALQITAHVVTVIKNRNRILKIDIPGGIIEVDGVIQNADDNALLGFN